MVWVPVHRVAFGRLVLNCTLAMRVLLDRLNLGRMGSATLVPAHHI